MIEQNLFVGCVFAMEVWFKLLEPLGLSAVVPASDCDLAQWWLQQRKRIDRRLKPMFDSLPRFRPLVERKSVRAAGIVGGGRRACCTQGGRRLAGFALIAAVHLPWSQHLSAM
jgi:hypothetical protein